MADVNIKVFNRWEVPQELKVEDPGLVDYVNLEPKFVPKTGGRYAKNRFHKSKVFIVERLINKLMVPGHKAKKHFFTSGPITGKASTARNQLVESFKLIERRTKQNPIKILVKAVENAAPREEIVTIEYGGARYPKSVECAPQRRIDFALKNIAQGSFQKAHKSKKSFSELLADEIIAAYNLDPKSNSLSKKLDLERQADASR